MPTDIFGRPFALPPFIHAGTGLLWYDPGHKLVSLASVIARALSLGLDPDGMIRDDGEYLKKKTGFEPPPSYAKLTDANIRILGVPAGPTQEVFADLQNLPPLAAKTRFVVHAGTVAFEVDTDAGLAPDALVAALANGLASGLGVSAVPGAGTSIVLASRAGIPALSISVKR